ncbi:MAG: SurA N-terminal domain-containing protein [Gammaproteobacteria bacterium]
MLQTIRDRAQGWITGVIIGLLVVAFALWGIESYLGSNASPDIVAKVNGVNITQEQLNLVYQRIRQGWLAQMGSQLSFDQSIQAQLKARALQQLVTSQVLSQAAIHQGYRVHPLQLDAVVMQLPAFQVNGQFSAQRFQEILNNMSYSQQQFVSDLEKTLLINQPQSGILGSGFALPSEINQAAQLEQQKRDVDYAILPAERFIQAVQLSPQLLQDYYQQHLTEFQSPAKVKIEYLQLSAQQLQHKVQVSNQELQQYYNENIQTYSEPQRWQIARLLIKVPNTKPETDAYAKTQINQIYHQAQQGNWTKLAEHYVHTNKNTSTYIAGEWITVQQLPEDLRQVVSNLKPGQTSQPFRNAEGYNIIKLMEVKKPQILPFEQARHQVEQTLQQQKLQQLFSDQSEQLSQLAYTNPSSLAPAAQALGLTLQVSDYFTSSGNTTGVTANPKVVAAAFSDSVKQGNNSDLIPIDDKTIIVLRTKDYQPAAVLPFTEVKDAIEKVLRQRAAQQQAKQLGEQLLGQLRQGVNPQKLAEQNQLRWISHQAVNRQTSILNGQILKLAFSLPSTANKTHPVFGGLSLADGDYALVGVRGVNQGALTQLPQAQQQAYRDEIENSSGQLDYELYVDSLMKQAKIVTNKT